MSTLVSAVLIITALRLHPTPPTDPAERLESPGIVLAAAGITPQNAVNSGLTSADCTAVVAQLAEVGAERTAWRTRVLATGEAGTGQGGMEQARAAFQSLRTAVRSVIAAEKVERLNQAEIASAHGLRGPIGAVPSTSTEAAALARALRAERRATRLGVQPPTQVAELLAAARTSARFAAATANAETAQSLQVHFAR